MAKATAPTAPPAPELSLAPAIEVSASEPQPETVVEVVSVVPDVVMGFVSADTTPEPATIAPAGPRTVRLAPRHGFPIRHFNGGVTFYPGYPAEVPLDAWLENQIACGILAEV